MGCVSSMVDNEEDVARCRARKHTMKHAVASCHALAFAHSQYLQALKSCGAAFRQFGEGERQEVQALRTSSTPFLTIAEALPPPPQASLVPTMHGRRETNAELSLLDVGRASFHSPQPGELKSSSALPLPRSAGSSRGPRKDTWCFHNRLPHPSPLPASNRSIHLHRPRSSWHNVFLDPFCPVTEIEFGPPSPTSPLSQQLFLKQSMEADGEVIILKEEGPMPGLENVASESCVCEGDTKVHLVTSEDLQVNCSFTSKTALVRRNVDMSIVKTAPNEELKVVVSSKGNDLQEVLKEVDYLFLKAAESGDPVYSMLESRKVHYHSSFPAVKGVSDQSAKVHNSTFWPRSLSRPSSSFSSLRKDFTVDTVGGNGGMIDSHVSTLDGLFAWEKKLFEEVKSAEVTRVHLEKKCSFLRSQDVKGADPLAIDKTQASIKVLHTRFMVALQAVDAASNAVHKLRDEKLYSHLLELLEGMTKMWKEMCESHEAQLKIVQEMKTPNYSGSAEATSSLHRQSTLQLAAALSRWVQGLSSVISCQREYLNNLNGWLQISLTQPDSELRNGPSNPENSAMNVAITPICSLCEDWCRALDNLPDKVAFDSINRFVDVVNEWVRLQSEEFKHKKKAESLERELNRKEQLLEMSERKYLNSNPSNEEYEHGTNSPRRASLNENRGRVDQLRLRVEQEKEEMEKSIHATRVMTSNSIHHLLPGVFNAMAIFASVAYQTYSGLSAHHVCGKMPCITG